MAGRSGGAAVRPVHSCEHWEIVKPTVSELSREVRTNILCTVTGCGKILPNPPALNMHLVKSHRVQDGIINPTLRKDLKASQKLYCCPIEGCPRGTNRPFSQFSLVKQMNNGSSLLQHFMKMHAEKKHKCEKCGNSYGTEWDLKRHIGYCGKTFECTCGCPYASRTALLSHTYRTGHEIPVEHRDPPVKKRKMEVLLQHQKAVTEKGLSNHDRSTVSVTPDLQATDIKPQPTAETYSDSCPVDSISCQPKHTPKLLLPKPKLALVKLPMMQLAHLPVLVSSSDGPIKPMVVAVNNRGSVMTTVQFLPQCNGAVLPTLDLEASLPTNIILSRNAGYCSIYPANSFVQVNVEKSLVNGTMAEMSDNHKNRITSDVQTDLSYLTQSILPDVTWTSNEPSVSSCSQTDLSYRAQAALPISVETQTLQQNSELSLSAEASSNSCFSYGVSRETQTHSGNLPRDILQVDQAVMCENIFNVRQSSYTVSTQTNQLENNFVNDALDQNLLSAEMREEALKSSHFINFSTQNSTFQSQNTTDNQTQTMELLSDLEKILSDNISGQSLDSRNLLSDVSSGTEAQLTSNCAHNPGIDFDIEEFFSASNIQTQTEESELGNLTSEYLDIETQTDFLFSEDSAQSYTNKGNSGLMGMEMFDTQTQTDLNLFLDNSSHLPLGSILKQSSFSMSTDSSDTDMASEGKNIPCHSMDGQVLQNSAETQTTTSCFETLGNLFLTSNETQTAMNDFLLADLAWNTMDSQFSSVETQTCDELFSLLNSEKPDN